jgi:hypothetical protein
MTDMEPANLRGKRRYIHRQLDLWEPPMAWLRASLAGERLTKKLALERNSLAVKRRLA